MGQGIIRGRVLVGTENKCGQGTGEDRVLPWTGHWGR